MKDLGTLGGTFGSAFNISEAGAIVGWANTPGDQVVHGFLWERGRMSDLGVVKGKLCSLAYAVNSKRQIVGTSDDDCAGGNAHAFFWEEGSLVDLNIFVSPNSGVRLTFALSINEYGEIASLGLLPNGDQDAFALIPCDENHPNVEGCDYSLVDADAAAPEANPAARDAASSRALPPSLLRRLSPVSLPRQPNRPEALAARRKQGEAL